MLFKTTDPQISSKSLEEKSQSDLEINRAVHLSLIEIVVGSVGHGFKIPLTGFFLSLNQLYFLANALNKDKLPSSSTFEISGIAAALKSLSVAGQKVGPMFAIMIQGALFYLGTFIGGTGLIGQLLAAILMTLWSFIQSLLTYFIVFGFDYLGMLNYLNEKLVLKNFELGHYLLLSIALAVIIKVSLGIVLILLSFFKSDEILFFKPENLNALRSQLVMQNLANETEPWKIALKDLLRPFFILNLAIMIFFFYQLEQPVNEIIWLSLRSLAIAYIIFYCARNKVVKGYLKKYFSRFYDKAEKVLEKLSSRN